MKKFLFGCLSFFLITACSNSDNGLDPIAPGGGDGGDGSGTPTTSITPCENGMAGDFPCDGYDLIGQIAPTSFNASGANDSWGWTDPDTGKEYAIMGLNNGTVFIDISDEENLVYLGKLATATVSSSWRDVKVYKDHAFIVSEAAGHGMQIFDLTRLRSVANAPATFDADVLYTEFGNAHNIVINEETGFAYAVGTTTFSGGGHFIDVRDPKNPLAAGGHAANAYTHDAQVVTYTGPDADYTGREIYIGANEDVVAIVDVTDKANPSEIATITYSNIGYTHQGWFTEDQRYFILGDELDEQQVGFKSRTLIFDFNDLDAPSLHYTYLGPTSAIDHNGYVKGDEFFLANYAAGVRVIDISQIDGKNVTEKAFFDTHPETDVAQFSGVWSVYPYFASGKIVVSDMSRGLFVIRKSN